MTTTIASAAAAMSLLPFHQDWKAAAAGATCCAPADTVTSSSLSVRKGYEHDGKASEELQPPSANAHPPPPPPDDDDEECASPGDPSSIPSKLADHGDGRCNPNKDTMACRYRSQLEQEVQELQEQLQEEIDLHIALANFGGHTSTALSFPCNLPDKAQELLASITALETTVSKLEEELASLHLNLTQERNERHLAEYHLGYFPSLSLMPTCCFSDNSWEKNISFLRESKNIQMPNSLSPDSVTGCGHPPPMAVNSPSDLCRGEKGSQPCNMEDGAMVNNVHLEQVDSIDSLNENFLIKNLWQHPNDLSEEMVRCMRNIFLCLTEFSNTSSKVSSSECFLSPCSPVGHLSNSSLTSFSDSSVVPLLVQSPLTDMCSCHEVLAKESSFDPYGVHGKVNWPNIGSYGSAAEVSWMVVGKKQLEYAAEALKIFRFLVEQLAKLSPAKMNCNQKLAFWINLYNALIMHAYLAYGVPRSDIKLFSLMQKVSYTVGGQSISAADIEYVILKMKPPAYRPQIALILALHKFKISEVHKKFSIDHPEPLSVFATSCGMYSSPAVRIFTANKVKEELQCAFRDYVQASVGISDKGKLLVPKLLHCFAKTVVEDSLLVDWICRVLSPEQAAEVRNSTSHRKQRLLGARSFCIVPFDSRFRYLFLPDNDSSRRHF